jgi:2-oxoglutarate ferredoxin oxidoreductase subunit gamma
MPEVMTKTHEVRIAGFGGQGVILAGFIIGRAASLFDHKSATMTQNYGPESRGGACQTDVIVSDEEIGYPKVKHPNVLVAMSQEAYTVNVPAVADSGMVIVDNDMVKFEGHPDAEVRMIPATRLAEELGKRVVANIIMLGFFTAQTGLVSPEAMRRAIQASVPARFTALNLKAFEVGLSYGQSN